MRALISRLIRGSRSLPSTLVGTMFAVLILASPCAGQQNVTAPGGVAVGRDIKDSTINFGLTPEQVKELTEAAARGAAGPLTNTIVDLSKRLGATEDATKTLLRIVGEQDVPLERLSEALNRVATDYKRLQAQAAALNPDNVTARDLVTQAKAAIDAGRFERARDLLHQAKQAQLAAAQQARKLREQAEAAENAQMLGAANATAVEADIALTERNYAQAAELFGEAAEYVPSGQADERLKYLDRQADALYRQGEERGDNGALREAIERYRVLLTQRPRDQVPLDWAMTQNDLGNALAVLGDRESGTTRLEEAVAAYRAALEERTRDRVPLDWAMTQNNLGNALTMLGEREGGTARLEEAVAAYRAALEEGTRDRVPLQWAMEQNNLGGALARLDEWEGGTARLEEAVTAFRAALEELTRERVPLKWATAQNNLGLVLQMLGEQQILGEQEGGTTRLEEAVAAYRAALEERTRDRVPLGWAMTQYNLGNTLKSLSEREGGTARLEEAVTVYDAALQVFTSAGADYYIDICRKNRDRALASLSERKH